MFALVNSYSLVTAFDLRDCPVDERERNKMALENSLTTIGKRVKQCDIKNATEITILINGN